MPEPDNRFASVGSTGKWQTPWPPGPWPGGCCEKATLEGAAAATVEAATEGRLERRRRGTARRRRRRRPPPAAAPAKLNGRGGPIMFSVPAECIECVRKANRQQNRLVKQSTIQAWKSTKPTPTVAVSNTTASTSPNDAGRQRHVGLCCRTAPQW